MPLALPEAQVFTGVDWATENHAVCVVNAAGKIVAQFTIEHSAAGIAMLIGRLAKFGDPGDVPVAIERPDGRLVDLLLEAGHPVVPVKPNAITAWRDGAVLFGAKSDAGDAAVIAEYLRLRYHRLAPAVPYSGETKALRNEVEQRARAVKDAAKDLENASALRQGAADAASQMGELAKQLTAAIDTADRRAQEVSEISRVLEDRASNLRSVGTRLDTFEARMSKWDVTEQEITRALELIASRQGTIESLQGDLERMFAMAEKTSIHVREITSAHQELEEGQGMLKDVLGQLKQLRETKGKLEERKRQMSQAEERLSKAEALLVDVQSSLSVLEGQKTLVDQAVEKAGSLQSLLRQAEAAIGNLREASRTMARPKHGKVVELPKQDSNGDEGSDEGQARAA